MNVARKLKNEAGVTDAAAARTLNDPRWAAVVARDRAFDGRFYYSVATTRVYCRPSCGARLARPENVRFHASPEDAEHAGFRPCKRCRPKQPALEQEHAERVTRAVRLLESAEEPPTLAELAEHVGLSAYHFHRVFKAMTGLTPREYATAHRAKKMRGQLENDQGTVTDAIFESGYGSSSRFYEKSNQLLGMTPTKYRAGGDDAEIHFAVGQCSLGAVLVARSAIGVCAISLGDDPETLVREIQDRFGQARLIGGDAQFEELIALVVGMIESPPASPSDAHLPLDVRGTAFQQRVWRALQEIPAGTTLSYAQLAAKLGAPKSARAVASACAANTLAVAIPCHRIVRGDGGLSGYRWGVERKRKLLETEREQNQGGRS